jgi:hypothetical protein
MPKKPEIDNAVLEEGCYYLSELGLSHDSTYQAYDGLLDDVRFYNQMLADADIASI